MLDAPVIAENSAADAAYQRVLARIEAVSERNLDPINVDLDKAGMTGHALAQKCASADVWPLLSLLPAALFDADVQVRELADLSLAARWLPTLHVNDATVDPEPHLPESLVRDATVTKSRMMATAEYCLEDEEAVRELASIREGTGYDDLKHDLRRLAVVYRERKADLSGRRYDAADEQRALSLADQINLRQRGTVSASQLLLERKLWSLLKRTADRVYAAAHFATEHVPLTQKSLRSIHTWRARTSTPPPPSTVAPAPPMPAPPPLPV